MTTREGAKTLKQFGSGPRGREFVIFSELGFFTGLANGGKLQWSMDRSKAKPFDEECKLNAVQKVYCGDLLIEYV